MLPALRTRQQTTSHNKRLLHSWPKSFLKLILALQNKFVYCSEWRAPPKTGSNLAPEFLLVQNRYMWFCPSTLCCWLSTCCSWLKCIGLNKTLAWHQECISVNLTWRSRLSTGVIKVKAETRASFVLLTAPGRFWMTDNRVVKLSMSLTMECSDNVPCRM